MIKRELLFLLPFVAFLGAASTNNNCKDAYDKEQWAAVVKECKHQADSNDVEAEYYIAVAYAHQGDRATSLHYYSEAANDGYPPAQYMLCGAYEYGRGVDVDKLKAFEWCKKAADGGYAPAQLDLGRTYHQGILLKKSPGQYETLHQDSTQAVHYLESAGKQGNVMAQRLAAYIHMEDFQDYSKAAYWFRRAAEQNDVESQMQLGLLYLDGNGVTQNFSEALSWLLKAADDGYRLAQFTVGKMYAEGKGTNKDKVRAYMWLNIAASKDHEEARALRDGLLREMCAKEVAEGQQLAQAFQREYAAKHNLEQ